MVIVKLNKDGGKLGNSCKLKNKFFNSVWVIKGVLRKILKYIKWKKLKYNLKICGVKVVSRGKRITLDD